MSLDNTWRLLQRQQILEQYSAVLFVNPPADLAVQGADTAWHIYAHSGVYTADLTPKHGQQVNAYFQHNSNCHAVVVFLPKEKALADFIFQQLANQLPIHTPCYIVGANDSGIRALLKKSIPGFAALHKQASGSHCQLIRTELLSTQPFVAADVPQCTHLNIQGQTYNVFFLPGVFGENRLDAGTALLLEHMPANIAGTVLDFGCGSGVISAWLCANRPITQLLAIDLSTLATTAASLTLASCSTAHEVRLSDGFQQVTERFDWIITNPPFHQGKQTDYRITTRFIQSLKQHLNPGGRVVMVANNFLPWPSLLQNEFKQVNTIAQNNRYTVTIAR
ncbi:class I SAM-dependent methyltransferase [Aliidiomarina quisquiliarum]|uniref:class I SAM-dependent methyltransferase n=1 Tax=Aliidiomarina quisquiliarum TaxID=2938947 RepID=UPI00208F7FED|nr:class I SAM-dependent methyltransferase [Aliidiomarina quisquiliarum]MCO4321538.1 class I SAM-dependent methyltransferase [Aliidiomarina quisquiliarum]